MPATTDVAAEARLRKAAARSRQARAGAPAAQGAADGRSGSALWPKLAAVGLAFFIWQCVVWSGWKPEYVLPGPLPVLETPRQRLRHAHGGGVRAPCNARSSGSRSRWSSAR